MLTKDNQIKAIIPDKDYSAYSLKRYKFFMDAPFEISSNCCDVMKKAPVHSYMRQTGRKPITAQMASESRLRTQAWLQNGCNAFQAKVPISNPMSFWTQHDVLLYIRKNNLPIASVYKEIVTDDEETGQINIDDICGMGLFDLDNVELHTTGCARTGCCMCGFGCHLESKSRFELIDEVSNPAIRDMCMRGGAFDTDGLWKPDNRGLGYWFVLRWINVVGGFNIPIPEYERYEREYGNDLTRQYLGGIK